jgi:hypothetical protein
MIEVTGIAVLFAVGGWEIGLVGVTAAFLSYVGGRAASTLFLIFRVRSVRGKSRA